MRALLIFLLLISASTWAAESATPPGSAVLPEAPPAETIDATYKKGVAYLLNSQNKDGSWGSFESARPNEVMLGTVASYSAFGDATTGLCVMALLGPARDNPAAARALEKGAKYLFDRPAVKRATGDVLYSVWTQIYVLEAACAVLSEPRLSKLHDGARKTARRQIETFGQIQGSEGGFGYYDFKFAGSHPTGSESCSFATAAALIALQHAAAAGIQVPEQLVQDALASVARLRLGTGAYIYGVYAQNAPQRLYNDIKGSLGRSQVCNLALWRHQSTVTQEDLSAGLKNLFQYHHFIEMGKGRPYPHESWYYTAGYYFFFGHYYAAQVAQVLPAEQGAKYLAALQSVMCRLQDADGSWWDFPLYGYHKAYGTAFALLTLETASRPKTVPLR
ncbi:MAG TPA: hypothetical protein VGP72_29610 [Planctomycetota bacterium]|jgi:hypothetical protein